MSLRQYAKRRNVSPVAVLNAVRSGRLRASVVQTDRGAKIADADLADREWTANTDHSRAPAYVKGRAAGAEPGDTPAPSTSASLSLLEASAREKEARAKIAELDYAERIGQLVDARLIESRLIEVHTRARTKLLGLVAKAKTEIPQLTRADLVTLDRLIRQSLEELSTEETPAPPAEGDA